MLIAKTLIYGFLDYKDGHAEIKIGRSNENSIDTRLATYKTHNPSAIFLGYMYGSIKEEREFQRQLINDFDGAFVNNTEWVQVSTVIGKYFEENKLFALKTRGNRYVYGVN